MTSETTTTRADHTVAIVVPVYRGEEVLTALLEELELYASAQVTHAGNRFHVSEVLLVYDSGPDRSDLTIRALGRPVRLRAAHLAGAELRSTRCNSCRHVKHER